MPLPLLPAALLALRAVGMTAGRSGLIAARQAMAIGQSRTWSSIAAPSANTLAAREFYSQAARHYGTPRPSGMQLMQFAQQQTSNQGAVEASSSLRAMALRAAGVTTALIALRTATKDAGRGIEERAQALRMFSPTINTAAALSERAALMRELGSARRVGGSTAALMAARSQLADARQPYADAATNVGNALATAFTKFQTTILASLPAIAAAIAPRNTALLKVLTKIAKSAEALERKQGGIQSDLKGFFRETSQGRFPMSPTPDEMRGNQRGRRG